MDTRRGARSRPSPPRHRYDRVLAFVLCALPLAVLVLRAFELRPFTLGPNPVEALLHGLGLWGLRLLLVTLCVRPAAVLLRQPRLMRVRRTVGLFAFAYLLLHFATWLALDRGFDLAGVGKDIAERPFITVGFLALLLLVPLAVTSTDRWMRRLGGRWQVLHRLVYPATLLGGLHFLWLVKADWREPALYLAGFAALMLWRWRRRPGRHAAAAPAPVRS